MGKIIKKLEQVGNLKVKSVKKNQLKFVSGAKVRKQANVSSNGSGGRKIISLKNLKKSSQISEGHLSENDDGPNTIAKLYVRLKESIKASGKTEQELRNLHPDILNIRLPRKGDKSKFFFAIFNSEKKALLAMEALRKRGDLFVKAAFGNKSDSGKSRIEEKVILEKIPKKKLRKLWC